MNLVCPKCKQRLNVAQEHQGKIVQCPACQTKLRVPKSKPVPVDVVPVRVVPSRPVPLPIEPLEVIEPLDPLATSPLSMPTRYGSNVRRKQGNDGVKILFIAVPILLLTVAAMAAIFWMVTRPKPIAGVPQASEVPRDSETSSELASSPSPEKVVPSSNTDENANPSKPEADETKYDNWKNKTAQYDAFYLKNRGKLTYNFRPGYEHNYEIKIKVKAANVLMGWKGEMKFVAGYPKSDVAAPDGRLLPTFSEGNGLVFDSNKLLVSTELVDNASRLEVQVAGKPVEVIGRRPVPDSPFTILELGQRFNSRLTLARQNSAERRMKAQLVRFSPEGQLEIGDIVIDSKVTVGGIVQSYGMNRMPKDSLGAVSY